MIENALTLYYKDINDIEQTFNGIVITEYNYSDDLMGKTQLSGSFLYKDTALLSSFNKKQYTYFRDNKFYLINPPSISKEYGSDSGMTKYNCVFTSEKDLLDNIPFTDLISTFDSTRYFTASRDFKFYGDVAEFGDRLYANLQENSDIDYVINIHNVIIGSANWLNALRLILGTKNQEDFFEFSFSYTSVFSALNLMYDTFIDYNLIWYIKNVDYAGVVKPTIFITDTVSNVGDFKSPRHVFEFGQGKGLEKISVDSTNNNILTRIAGHGGTENIPFDYPVIYNVNEVVSHPYKRNYLMPNVFIEKLDQKYNTNNPNYDPDTLIIDYYDAVDETGYTYTNHIDLDFPLINKEAIIFDIKPTIKGIEVGGQRIDKVKAISTDLASGFSEEFDEDTTEYLQPTFNMELYPLGFDLYNQASEKGEMTINMTSGLCVGCAFKVNINEEWLPSFDKNLLRCTTDSVNGEYNLGDWIDFFNEEQWQNIWRNITFGGNANNLACLNYMVGIWETYFKPLMGYYDEIAQVVYGDDYAEKYLVFESGYPSEAHPIEYWISLRMNANTIYANYNTPVTAQNATTVGVHALDRLKMLLSDVEETYPHSNYNYKQFMGGYARRIAELKYNFLKHPVRINSRTTIIQSPNLITPSAPYFSGDLWVTTVRLYSINTYPNSTSSSITLSLTKDKDTFGTLLPTNDIKPVMGDTFVITGINLPQSYIQTAQDNLDIALKDRLLEDNVDKLNYAIPFDEKFVVENPTLRTDYFKCGNIVSFKVNSLIIERTINQISIEVSDDKALPKYTCTVSDDFQLRVKRVAGTTVDSDTNDRRFKEVDDTITAQGRNLDDVRRIANLGVRRFVAEDVYQLRDGLSMFGQKYPLSKPLWGTKKSIEKDTKKTIKSLPFTLIPDYIINAGGNLEYREGYEATDFIDISGGGTINFSTYLPAGGYIATYVVGHIFEGFAYVGADTLYDDELFSCDLPETMYIRCCNKPSETEFDIYLNVLGESDEFKGVLGQGNTLEQKVLEFSGDFDNKVDNDQSINFDLVTEPTQTGTVTKTSTWLWQYLTQSVNWLRNNIFTKAEKLTLSVTITDFNTFNPATIGLGVGESCNFIAESAIGRPTFEVSSICTGTIQHVLTSHYIYIAYAGANTSLYPFQYAIGGYNNGFKGWQLRTAQGILDLIKTVDGTGSGLDADLLDGKHASEFATLAQGLLANTALQAITQSMVEAVLTGLISTHTHNYTTSTDVTNAINAVVGDIDTILDNINGETL